MPSRWIVVGILLFWLVSMSWLVVRDVVPRFNAGEPPPFVIDLTDEVGANSITWAVMHKGARVGSGFSMVRRPAGADDAYDLTSEFKFDKFEILKQVSVRKLSSRYRVTTDGALLEVEAKIYLGEAIVGLSAELKGVVRDAMLHPEATVPVLGTIKLDPFPVSERGSILNPMHLLNKITGLSTGQTWAVPSLDPVATIVPGVDVKFPKLRAQVFDATLSWHGKDVPCFRVDYLESDNEVKASTWVRRRDGVVLQQQANHPPLELLLVREINK